MSDVSYRDYSGSAAQNYERYFVPSIGRPASDSLLRAADLQPGERVLDVACGTGLIARLAAERVGPDGSVTGVDMAPDMIDVAKTASAPAVPVIDWQIGDATALDLGDESYDVVLCQMGLMLMADPLAAVQHMHRVLAPGGRIALSTPGAIQEPMELMATAIADHINPDLAGFVRAVFSMPDAAVLGGLLEDAGFNDVSATEEVAVLELPSPAEFLWQYINLTPLGPFVAEAPEQAQQAMENQVVETWTPLVEEFTENGTIRFDQPMAVATATKS